MYRVQTKYAGKVAVIEVQGSLDAMTSGEMKSFVDELFISNTNEIVFDLTNIELIDSSGFGVLVHAFKIARAKGGDVVIAGLSGQPIEVFRILNLNKAIKTVDSVDEAIDSFS